MNLGSLFLFDKAFNFNYFLQNKGCFCLIFAEQFSSELVLKSMKKVFSIMFAILILASGMHFSIATHFCGGEVASKKISLSGSVASCGMEDTEQEDCSASDEYNSNCCKNTIATYAIDSNYENSSFKISGITKNLLKDLNFPVCVVFNSMQQNTTNNNGVSPPDFPLASAVSLDRICIFRI